MFDNRDLSDVESNARLFGGNLVHAARCELPRRTAMIDAMDRKIRRMYAALDALSSTDLSSVTPHLTRADSHVYAHVDFNEKSEALQLENAAQMLTANIASIKDHLHAWCRKNSRPLTGDDIINSNASVAIIHDLWNVEKHAELSRPPRSGFTPSLRNLSTALQISAGEQAGGSAFFSMDPRTGKITSGATVGGNVSLTLTAQIVDEHGMFRADFLQTCEAAIEAWMNELKRVGVPLS